MVVHVALFIEYKHTLCDTLFVWEIDVLTYFGVRKIAHRRIAHQDLSLVGQLLTSGHHNFILFYFLIIL